MANEENKDKIRNEVELKEDVIRLKSWLKVQPHLPHDIEPMENDKSLTLMDAWKKFTILDCVKQSEPVAFTARVISVGLELGIKLDEELFTAFVYGTKSLEKAKTKLDAYFTQRGKYRKYFDFSNRDPLNATFQEACQALKVVILPEATDEGYRLICGFPHQDIQKFNHQFFDIQWMMLVELAMIRWPKMTGLILITDMSSADSSLLKKMDLCSAAFSINWLQEAVPFKLKLMMTINTPAFTDVAFNMIKPFIKRKFHDRLVISSEGPELLRKYMPIDIFPQEYGGKEKSAEELNDYWMNALVENRDWFAKTSQQFSDEKKRPPGTNSSIQDEGTFRYLQID